MRLDDLIATDAAGVREVSCDAGLVDVSSLAYDSRAVGPGALFFCVDGLRSDGHSFAAQALERGAVALVVERPLGLGAPEILVSSTRASMGPIAARFYGDPTASLRVVGVTGTNGKTTSAYLVRALLEADGARCGLLGTVKSVIGGVERPAVRTTPEAIDLQADFRAMLDGGDEACAMEVSSHALALGRADAIHFAAAVFTNLTQDHLDFHPTMDDYFAAKRRLFAPPPPNRAPGVAVVNVDDPYGRRLVAELDRAVTFAVGSDADYRARDVRLDMHGVRMRLCTPAGERAVALSLPGRFNALNALGAIAACHSLGLDLDTLVGALGEVRVPGRVEPVEEGQRFAVLVDYAHTPDSLQNVLQAARELADAESARESGDAESARESSGADGERERDDAPVAREPGDDRHAGHRGRVICVFGAGGDRDKTKRPLMGEIGARMADVAIVTSDNPRSESPQAIIEQVMEGAARAARADGAVAVQAEVDRRAAIDRAMGLAHDGDVVVIAGKGHEQGQEFANGLKLPFDDVTVAREALRSRARARAA